MKVELKAPRNFSEMTEKQLRYLAALIIVGQTEDQIRTKCFIRFTGIRPIMTVNDISYFVKPKLKGFFTLRVEEVVYFSKKLDFLNKQQYAGIRPIGQIGKYKPVDRLLRDITFGKYLDAENYYQAYIFTRDEKYLIKLMAVLFVAKKHDIKKAEKYFSRKKFQEERFITTMWMMGIKEEFARKFNYLFVRPTTSEGDGTPPNMLEIITNQVRMLTDGDITKNNLVLSANTWDALTELNNKCRESADLKK